MITNLIATILITITTNIYAPTQYWHVSNITLCGNYSSQSPSGGWYDRTPYQWGGFNDTPQTRDNPDVRITEPGWYYFASNKVDQFTPVEVYSDFFGSLRSRGRDTRGGLWGGRVPAPGTTFTIQEFLTWIHDVVSNSTFRFIDPIINDPQSGIAATTARHRREQG